MHSQNVSGCPLNPNVAGRMLPKSFIYILILVVSLLSFASNNTLVNTLSSPVLVEMNHLQVRADSMNSTSSRGLAVDIYTDTAGRGQNVSIGTYPVGEQIKFYVYVSQNCSFTLNLITPNGSVWNRMVAPMSAGTFVDYVDAEYPIGAWKIETIAQQGSRAVTETAPFEVVEKTPFTLTRTYSFNTSTIEEVRFNGKVVRTYLYPVGGVYAWDVQVDQIYFGPDIRNVTVKVQLFAISYTPNYPPGFVDYNITLGDHVEVYGLISQTQGQDMTVTLNGSENYYIKKQSTLFESPEIIFFARKIFADNLTVRIEGVAIPGNQSATISNVNWNWGDDTSSDHGFPATHAYAKPGTYLILIKALQSDGLTTTKSISITVPENAYSVGTETTTSGLTNIQTTNQPTPLTESTLELWIGLLLVVTLAVALATVTIMRARTKKSALNKPN